MPEALLSAPTPAMPRWRLRPVAAGDEPLLRCIYASTRQDELDATDWSQTQRAQFLEQQFRTQASHYQAHNPGAEHGIVEVPGEGGAWVGAGRLWLDRRPDALHVLDIALLPEHCGRGLGSAVLHSVMQRAQAAGRVVTIYVRQGNPARRLYERLGFVPVGPLTGVHQRMAWRGPPRQADRQVLHQEA